MAQEVYEIVIECSGCDKRRNSSPCSAQFRYIGRKIEFQENKVLEKFVCLKRETTPSAYKPNWYIVFEEEKLLDY